MKTMGSMLAGLVVLVVAVPGCLEYNEKAKGDLNGDGRLDVQDLSLLQDMVDQGSGGKEGDLNGDGQVDLDDLEVLEGLVCQAIGGTIVEDGRCCTTATDGTVCCDPELDGTFSECDPVIQVCRENADCQALNCQAFCGSDGRCHCVDMCTTDEDCQVLNCPAFCNVDHRCECKVPCAKDEDCLFIQHCPSVCDEAAGHCVCGPTCLGAGERAVNLTPEQTPCCAGLAALEYTPYDPVGGGCVYLDALVTVCVACGDGACGAGEDTCICPEDCGECVPGAQRAYACGDGTSVPWCTCDAGGHWECILSPETQCASDCHGLGDRFVDFEGTARCCAGLQKMTDSMPSVIAGQLTCDYFDCLCYVCLPCGDGQCAPEENFCTCPSDCPVPECVPGDTLPCTCGNHLAEEPACFSCGADGKWYTVEWFADPCLCHASPAGCAEGFVCQPADGQCVVDCRLSAGVCGPLVCDTLSGLCVEPGCLGEGEQFEDPDPEGKCCAGLTPVTFVIVDETSGECVGVNCPCFVCTRCGDGVCGAGENRCNCASDCVGSAGCEAATCTRVDHSYWASGDCLAGQAPPELPIPVEQSGCSLTFTQILADVLGTSGCIDHDIIFTAGGCTGSANQIGVSITMYFTCTRDDGTTCSLFLDDGID